MQGVRIFAMVLLLVLIPLLGAGEVYRCRDASGTLVMTDDPSKFPPGCDPVEEGGAADGAFNVIQTPAAPPVDPAAIAREVREQQAVTSRRQDLIESWKDRAKELAQSYRAAVDRRNQAYNSWSYDSREVVRQSLEQMEKVKQQKAELLREVSGVFVPAPDREAIREALSAIP